MDIALNNRIYQISTTHLCDAYPGIRIIHPSIKPLYFAEKFIGGAFTVKSEGDLLPIIKAIEIMEENVVLIIDSGDSQYAALGEIFTNAAKNKKVQGIIIDGFCRDISEIQQLGVSLYAKGVFPRAGTKNKLGLIQTEIVCGGVVVQPNDIVFGDENGVVILSSKEAALIIDQAEQIKGKEKKALEKIKNGRSFNDVLNFNQHYENIAGSKESELFWKV